MKAFSLVLSLVVLTSSQEIDNSLDCLVNYLRINGLDDEVFDKVPTTPKFYPSDACKRRITSEKDSVYIEAFNKYEKHPEISLQFDCFMDSIKNNDSFKDLLLQKKAIDSIKLSFLAKLNPINWFPGKKYRAVHKVEANISDVETENLYVCEFGRKFEENFDTFLDVENINIKRSDEVYCTKNYLERSKLGQKGDAHCEAFLTSIKARILANLQSFYARYKRSVRRCLDDSIATSDYFSPEFRVKSFAETLSDSQRSKEKKIYVDAMMNLFRSAMIRCTK